MITSWIPALHGVFLSRDTKSMPILSRAYVTLLHHIRINATLIEDIVDSRLSEHVIPTG